MNSENLLDKLLKEGKLKKQATDISYLNASLNAAHQNFAADFDKLRDVIDRLVFKICGDFLGGLC